jgi:uncharacterized lipoprotein YajG
MKKKMFFLLLTTCLLWSASIYAQSINVSGKVTDAQSGEALPGVSISIKGTTLGTITDVEGKYTISTDAKSILGSLKIYGGVKLS